MSPSPLTQSLITGVRSDIKEVIKILAMYCCMAHSLISSNFQTNGTVKFLKKSHNSQIGLVKNQILAFQSHAVFKI